MSPMQEPLLNLVLLHPQIPNNTGNVGRTAAVTGCRLHIVHPIAFDMSEKARRRAGLDYWHLVDCREHASWEAYLEAEQPSRAWLYTTASSRPHWQASFGRGDHLLFGSETEGAPKPVHDWIVARFGEGSRLNLPMRPHPDARSLNLATAVACGAYEGLRQIAAGAPGGRLPGFGNP
jgi:tRNA (cytidine/uridine-2'-O-)-methyltransferase